MDDVLINTSRTYRINGFARLRYLVLPSATPQIMTGIRQSLSIGLILMVISEMFGAILGIGLHHRALPARLRHPRDVVRHRRARASSASHSPWSSKAVEGKVLRWYHGLKEVQRDS